MRRVLFFSLFAAFWTVSVTSCDKDDDFDAEILEGIDEQGAIVGKFSIAPNCQVQFSRGNLQYQASTNTWKFADHQYDVVGNGNLKRSATYSGWIDLFVRGTSGCDSLLPPYANATPYDHIKGYHIIDMDICQTEYDWGNNPIKNGGDISNMWRTLTDSEWDYLLFKRKNAQKLLGFGIVNHRFGVIILPDNWTSLDEIKFKSTDFLYEDGYYVWNTDLHYVDAITEENVPYNDNIISKAEWCKMQQSGAVFMPVTGTLSDDYFTSENVESCFRNECWDEGNYWTSSLYKETFYNGGEYVTNTYPKSFYFYANSISMASFIPSRLCSVRLVKNVK